MGYESRVYIVNEWDTCVYWEGEKPIAETIAEFDLCCVEVTACGKNHIFLPSAVV